MVIFHDELWNNQWVTPKLLGYPLVNIQKTIENGHQNVIYPSKMVICPWLCEFTGGYLIWWIHAFKIVCQQKPGLESRCSRFKMVIFQQHQRGFHRQSCGCDSPGTNLAGLGSLSRLNLNGHGTNHINISEDHVMSFHHVHHDQHP